MPMPSASCEGKEDGLEDCFVAAAVAVAAGSSRILRNLPEVASLRKSLAFGRTLVCDDRALDSCSPS